MKAHEEAAATAAAADTAATATVDTSPNTCVPPVPQIGVQPTGGPTPVFGRTTSVSGLTIAPPNMQY